MKRTIGLLLLALAIGVGLQAWLASYGVPWDERWAIIALGAVQGLVIYASYPSDDRFRDEGGKR